MQLYEYVWIILLYGHLLYLTLLVFAKAVIIKSQRKFMYGSNFYGSDVRIASGLGIDTPKH